ncbi:MAG TPA: DUF4157 domain-containing protein [Kofleriaceae bacterium]|jgi:hypothetical protein|nr:DUF4157 domain-containing protein [Kofleriaceae bacterium]
MSIDRHSARHEPGSAGASITSSAGTSSAAGKGTRTDGSDPGSSAPGAVGKHTLTEGLVQRKERPGAGAGAPVDAQAIASAGVAGGGGPLPFADRIQALFGSHDVSGISAHVGGPAAVATHDLGATAYATGNQVAFAGPPDLHTAAHEAAHVVQQRGGVSLKGGVGSAGDSYERHADAVADRVVAGQSAQDLLDGGAGGGSSAAVQRRELPDATPISAPSDWHAGDRGTLGGTFETANLHNLAANDHAQYLRIEERRDFYRWFYNYTSARGYTTRWALAASLVANGAQQVAHMDPVMEGAAQLTGAITDELQGMMRIGNQVIFDNVFPKLGRLLAGGPRTGAAALAWDMATLAEEQTLIQPLYAGVSPATIAALNDVARQQGWASIGAWATNGAHVAAGPYNRGGDMPAFGTGAPSASITNIGDRWNYGMQVVGQFTPAPTGFTPGTPMPAVGASYTGGAELAAVDTRHNLHMLDACLDSPRDADPARILSLLRALTPTEQALFNTDESPDGTQYSNQLAECSFDVSAFTGMILERTTMTSSIPSIVGAYTGGPGPSTVVSRYNTKIASLRSIARSTLTLPPLPMGGMGGF